MDHDRPRLRLSWTWTQQKSGMLESLAVRKCLEMLSIHYLMFFINLKIQSTEWPRSQLKTRLHVSVRTCVCVCVRASVCVCFRVYVLRVRTTVIETIAIILGQDECDSAAKSESFFFFLSFLFSFFFVLGSFLFMYLVPGFLSSVRRFIIPFIP